MGFAPPRDAPPPSQQAGIDAQAGFEPSPTGSTLCGFPFPVTFQYGLTFRIPFPPLPFPLGFDWFIAFKCDLSNPIDAGAGFSAGGGRVSTVDPDSDPEYGEGLDNN